MDSKKPSYDYLHAFWTLHQTKEAYDKAVKEWERQVLLSKEDEDAPYEEEDDDQTVRDGEEEQNNSSVDDDNLSISTDDSSDESNILQQNDNLRQERIDIYLQKRRRDNDMDSLGESVKQLRFNNESSSNMVIDDDEDI